MEPVPAAENHGIVGVGFGTQGRVVKAVHPGGDDDLVEQALQSQRQADIAVMEHGFQLKMNS